MGVAWQRALDENPEITLWDQDGSHPSPEGSYLAASVFYALITGESPVGLEYRAKADEEIASFLQSVASNTVNTDHQLLTQESPKMTSMIEDPGVTTTSDSPDKAANQPVVSVPQGISPTINGAISLGEWDDATIETFADGSELLLLHADGYLYLGIRANTTEMIVGNVFVNSGEEISILHVSAALGTALYQQETNVWQQTKAFEWCCRGTSDSASAQTERDDFFQREGWVSINSRVGTPNELEYQIKIGDQPIRLAVNYLTVSSSPDDEKPPWPAGLDDDVIKPTPGGLPLQFNFAPERWVILDFQSPK